MTESTVEAWPLPNVWRLLPADISDAEFVRVIEEMQQEVIDMGVPRDLMRSGVTPQADGRWLAQAWQAKDRYSWEWPPVDPADYA